MLRKRRQALRLLDQGQTEADVARALRVGRDRIRRWDDDAAIDNDRDLIADALGLDPIGAT